MAPTPSSSPLQPPFDSHLLISKKKPPPPQVRILSRRTTTIFAVEWITHSNVPASRYKYLSIQGSATSVLHCKSGQEVDPGVARELIQLTREAEDRVEEGGVRSGGPGRGYSPGPGPGIKSE